MAFVVTDGALRGVERAAPPPLFSMRIGETINRDYATLWRVQPELRTVVDFLSRNIAQLGLHAFRRVSDVDRERLSDHPIVELFTQPNPNTTRFRLIDALMHDLCIFDNGYWLKVRVNGQTAGLRRVRPQRIFPLGPDWLEPDQYEIVGTRGTLVVDASSVVHFHGYNPNDDRLGTPPIESLRQVLAEEYAANIYREQLWRNGSRIAGYIQRPVDAPDWGSKGRDRFRDEWASQYTGNAATGGSTPILEDGMTFVAAATNPRDAQYIESRKLTREEVARTFHVPLPMVGILDHATFSNIVEQHKQLYQDCLGPWTETIQEDIELQLLPDLPDNKNVYVEFNIGEKLRGSFEEQATQLQLAVGAPWMTRNEARSRLNLPQIDGGDDLITPLNLTVAAATAPEPIDADTDQQAARPPQAKRRNVKARAGQHITDSAAEDLARFFRRQGQVLMSALGAKAKAGHKASADDLYDTDRWNAELTADFMRINHRISRAAALDAVQALEANTDDFDPEVMDGWLSANASGVAEVVNRVTEANVGDALNADDPLGALAHLFDVYAAARAVQLATTQTAQISGFATVEAARQVGGEGATKTWVTGPKPRASHARMNGETVGLHDTFSNGARWPADSNLDEDEVAGCNCALVINA